mgnify:CR=1 FL=1|jgi:uncharacterized protein (DUF1697 family)
MSTHIALMRGINVGGRNRLPMSDLTAVFIEAGCTDVRTYIQSGNVIFQATDQIAAVIPTLIPEAIFNRSGFRPPTVTRSVEEFRLIPGANPFLHEGSDPKMLHVVFLDQEPTESQLAALDPELSPPDEISVSGREIFLHCPKGIARTKFTNAYFDRKLDTTSTIRNWNTVQRLLGLID